MTDLPKQTSHLNFKKHELVEQLLKKRGIHTPQVQAITPRVENSPCQLSFAQQRLWFLNQLEPGNPFYNRPAALRLTGQLQVDALEKSFQEIVQRHEALRTTFTTVEGQPLQVIAAQMNLTVPIVNLQELPKSKQEAEVLRLATEESLRPFDLTQGPLLRVTSLQLGELEHVVLLTMHHIVSDGWSIGVLIHELVTLYQAFVVGKSSPLPKLPIQYADFAVWQRQWLQGKILEAQLSYWQQQLSDTPPILELPTDRPRPAVPTYRGATKSLVLSQSLTEALKAISAQESATLFMTLLAAFKTLLYRYSGQENILVGSPIANRNRSEIEGLIGFFVNTLVLRTDLSGNPSFRELLQRVREVALGAYAHQDLPFEKLVEELQPERHLSRNPLFDVMFVFQNAPADELQLPDLMISPLNQESRTTNFDLTLSMVEAEAGLVGSLEHSTDLFDDTTIERMLGHFQTLLESIVAAPDQRLSELRILTPAEQQQLLFDWNNTEVDYPHQKCIHELVEAQVERTPDAIAVVFEDSQLIYREINARANQIAHHLNTLGVGPEVMVGICVERSPDMIVGLLGILKAGGVYVPLEPSLPKERMRQILSSLDVNCIVTQYSQLRTIQELQWQLPQLTDVICLDVDTPKPPPEPLQTDAVRALWDYVAEQASDRITAGGFISSYTGNPFSLAEVDAYQKYVFKLAQPYLGSDKRVLEIGCGSGLIMFDLAPHVCQYIGVDPSEVMQTHNRDYATKNGYYNTQFITGFAHDIAAMEVNSCDLIILASTVQFFPGSIYLHQVLEIALQFLVPGGVILIADIMDARRKDEFKNSLAEFQHQHRYEPHIKTKTDLENELYLDESFFCELEAESPLIAEAKVLHRQEGFDNELGYRYDIIIKKTDLQQESIKFTNPVKQRKNVWTNWHLQPLSTSNLSSSVTSESLAYIIHTSGSTGVPKGVAICHKSVVNLIDWVNKTYQVGLNDRILFITSICFDLSVYDIFGLLAAGGSIRITTPSELQDPEHLLHILCYESITFWDSAPAALQQLVPFFSSQNSIDQKHQLRLVFLSGDWIPITLPDALNKKFPGVEVISLGGATEATIWSNYYPIAEVKPDWVSIPYGKPIQNAQYYILDSYLNPCPIGVPGDLYIGGDCLAYGYYNNPSQTAEKFIPNHFSSKPGTCLYKTGDLARYQLDGNIEFLGRSDHQVKIRGFRIECGEIEVTLSRHSKVQQAIVIDRENVFNHKQLVAYVVPKQKQTPSFSTELRRFLKANLPDYMVPAAFVLLETMPLTANGKIDRRMLPPPDQARLNVDTAYIAPRTLVEEHLAKIWTQVLGIEKVGIHDNFFDLGGHSLLVTQLLVRVREILQVELSLRSLFEMPTIAELAESIELAKQTKATTISTKTAVNLQTEAVLDSTIYPQTIPFEYVTEPKCIFFTGVTGFVGAFLLHELLQQTQADVYCLVRSTNIETGKKRIQSSLESYLLWNESQSSRIIPVIGDLSQPLLGLSEAQFHAIATKIDVIYHSGAWVHHTSPYSTLKAANVLGTQEILRLASQIKVKPVHFISTNSVFSPPEHTDIKVVREEDNLDDYQVPSGGYSQSKWVAEKLVKIALYRGLPVSIYRLGRISGDSKTGVFNQNDFLYRLIIGCIQLGSVPDTDLCEDMVSVDYVSKAIIYLSQQEKSLGKAFHFVNRHPFHSHTLINLLYSLGYPLQQISYDQWQAKLFQIAETSPGHALYPLVPLLLARVSSEETSPSATLHFDCENTLAGLANTSLVCPPIDEHLLHVYLSYLIHKGFLGKPQTSELTENFL